MDKLYVFAVGGSGERVMNSLVMLLAAGMKVGANKIVPVFIDNDVKSHALKTSIERIEYYNGNTAAKKGFYEVCEWARLQNRPVSYCPVQIAPPIVLSKNDDGSAIENLEKVIGPLNEKNLYEDEIKIEKELLFTDDDLKMPLDVGFIGNPNVGSVVMNCTSLNNNEFRDIYGNAGAGDGVIVVGSLFGGTGASGIPLIVNRFLEKNNERPAIAGLSILPYFTFPPEDRSRELKDDELKKYDVDADSFDSKTRAALIYYDQYMRQLDYLYYVGDGGANKALYAHYKGGSEQENPTHVVELMSALSIIDFSNNGKTRSVIYKSPIWQAVTGDDKTLNLSGIQLDLLTNSLIKFQMMKSIFEINGLMNKYISEKALFVESIAFRNSELDWLNGYNEPRGEACWGLWHLFKEWDKWSQQLHCDKNRSRAFWLFNNDMANNSNNISDEITKYFYAERYDDDEIGFGIAKATTSGFLVKSKEPMKPKIMQALIDACKKAGDDNNRVTSDPNSLSKMVSYMSDAIDEVINNSCLIGKIL